MSKPRRRAIQELPQELHHAMNLAEEVRGLVSNVEELIELLNAREVWDDLPKPVQDYANRINRYLEGTEYADGTRQDTD